MDIDCEFDLIFLDTQARFQLSQFQVSLIADIEASCTHNKLQLKKNLFRNNPHITMGKYNRKVIYWSTPVDLKCGYFNIILRTTQLAQMSLPILPLVQWAKLLPFKLPLQGSDLFQDLEHNVAISNVQRKASVIAHFDSSQYIANTRNKVPSRVYLVSQYSTAISISFLATSSCSAMPLTMDIITRSTSDLYPYFYHHFALKLNLTMKQSFTFTEYLLMEQRYIRILPQQGLRCDGYIQLKINPMHPLPQMNSPHIVKGRLYESNKDFFEDYKFIILYDVFRLSWNDAVKKCLSFGGRLPVINTNDKVQMLTRLLLGDTFSDENNQRFIRTPCRQNHGPLCGTFLGLHILDDKVCVFSFFATSFDAQDISIMSL